MKYSELTSPDLGVLAASRVVVLPLGSVEQHGDHLPVVTDTALVTRVAEGMDAARSEKILLLPTLWLGSSHHHLGFPGTVSVTSETYIRMLVEMVQGLVRGGFRRIFLLNGHGGNHLPAQEALYRLRLEWERDGVQANAANATYWLAAAPELAALRCMQTPHLTHACEYETSMMLHLRLDWVKMERARGGRCQRDSKYYDPLGYERSSLQVSETFAQLTENGAMGSPELATAAKGETLFATIVPALIDMLDDFARWPLR